MCGIFGIISDTVPRRRHLRTLARRSERRGKDSSGLVRIGADGYEILRSDRRITSLLKGYTIGNSPLVFGHSRLVTNGTLDNQPVVRDGVIVVHNGIVVNHKDVWAEIEETPDLGVDTEVIAALIARHIDRTGSLEGVEDMVFGLCQGVLSCLCLVPAHGKLLAFTNNGSLFEGRVGDDILFASEAETLRQAGCRGISVVEGVRVLDVPVSAEPVAETNLASRTRDLVPSLNLDGADADMLVDDLPDLRRCSRCILPETFPYIAFDSDGVCNYCHNYVKRNQPKPIDELHRLLAPYRRDGAADCIIPFSGGRDSCFTLHLAVKELGLRPVTYTYDWAMVTDLARRNISRMCGEMGVDNIIVADDIETKRRNIRMNLVAFLKAPHLGMVSILTAGDKHFFRHVETIKNELGIRLNLWGVNPLEITHFKAGFLGVPPNFAEKRVYNSRWSSQARYQSLRFRAMLKSPGYFNASLWDTLSGEYFRSLQKKDAYFHMFDYWKWDEQEVDGALRDYGWETAVDTESTWRIGDGTAAFYNYVYQTIAGFTEHDTFRSNQIREGMITRDQAIQLVSEENRPRYANIKWYLDTLDLEFRDVIAVINSQPRLYRQQGMTEAVPTA
ncbi:MAG: glucosamine 6-phosphate synthetase [Candidatus Puniceispirillaceae bacterium]